MNIVPEDDVGLVVRSGESEPGLGHDLDEAVSSEGAARSDLHAGRMKSLRHLFMMDVQQPATRGRTTPSPTHARQRSEQALLIVVVAVRSVHLLDGGLTLAAAWHAYRHPAPDGGLLLLALIESVVILSVFWRRRAVRGPALAGVDVAFGMVALVAMVALTPGSTRSSWVNWACPFTYGSVVIVLLACSRRAAAAVALAFAGVYLVTVASSLTAAHPDLLATSLANAMTYIGLLVAGSVFFGALRRSAAEADDARAEAVTRGARLAAERERNAQHRLLHDSALQTLEIVAQSTSVDDAVRCQARSEAMTLRLALQGEPATGGGGLLEGLRQLAIQFADRGLRVEVHDTGLESRSDQAGVRALCDATREALVNIVKHAGVDRAVVSARSTGTGTEVTVRDQGTGFDPLAPPAGFGLRQSIEGRLAEVDGTVNIWSAPGRGTRVTMAVPL
jgi:signal transduction histidine kinase